MLCYMSRGIAVADGIKVSNLLTLMLADDPGLSRWTQSNHMGPSMGKGVAERSGETRGWLLLALKLAGGHQ